MTTESMAQARAAAKRDEDWWRGASIYQVYPRSFCDSNDDGVGDLQGVARRLDHVASLGVDAVWISPFYTSPMRDFGYDVADYRDVDPLFGRLSDFDDLVARAHALGLKVITDLVLSHTSDAHAWFEASRQDRLNPHADWYVWADPKPDGSPPSNWQSVFGGPAWTWDARRGQYYLHNFLPSQPDLNVHNEAVQEALLDVARFWLDRGVDGFRLDAVNFLMHDQLLRDNPPTTDTSRERTRPFDFQDKIYNQSHPDIPAFLTRMRALADGYGDRFLVAEVGGALADSEMKQFTHGPDRLHSAYGFMFLYADELTPDAVRRAAVDWPGGDGEGWPSWTFSNHDAPRAVSRWSQGRDPKAFADMALMLLACLRGNIFIYQGEELGLTQAHVPFERLQDPEAIANWPRTLGRDGARTPMPWRPDAPYGGFSTVEPWLPVDPAHLAACVENQELDPTSTLHVARRALAMRRAQPALRTRTVTFHEAPDPLIVFERGAGSQAVLCVFNLGHAALTWTAPDGWRVIEAVNADTAVWSSGAQLNLEPMAALVAVRADPSGEKGA